MLPGNCFGWGCGQTLAYWLEVHLADCVFRFSMQLCIKNIVVSWIIRIVSSALDVLFGWHLLGLLHLDRPLHHLSHHPPQGTAPGGVDLTNLDLKLCSRGEEENKNLQQLTFFSNISVCYFSIRWKVESAATGSLGLRNMRNHGLRQFLS